MKSMYYLTCRKMKTCGSDSQDRCAELHLTRRVFPQLVSTGSGGSAETTPSVKAPLKPHPLFRRSRFHRKQRCFNAQSEAIPPLPRGAKMPNSESSPISNAGWPVAKSRGSLSPRKADFAQLGTKSCFCATSLG